MVRAARRRRQPCRVFAPSARSGTADPEDLALVADSLVARDSLLPHGDHVQDRVAGSLPFTTATHERGAECRILRRIMNVTTPQGSAAEPPEAVTARRGIAAIVAVFCVLGGYGCSRSSPSSNSERVDAVDENTRPTRADLAGGYYNRGLLCRSDSDCFDGNCFGPPSRPAPGRIRAISTNCQTPCSRDADCRPTETCRGWGSRWSGPGMIQLNPFTGFPVLALDDGGLAEPLQSRAEPQTFCLEK